INNMVLSFRVSELQMLLGFAGRNKSGRKTELQARAVELLRLRSTPVQMKIKDLYKSIQQTKSPFQLLEDTDALLSEYPPASQPKRCGTSSIALLVAMKPAFVTCHNTRQKIITFISKSLKEVMGDGSSLNTHASSFVYFSDKAGFLSPAYSNVLPILYSGE
ncbi:hypothetical protein L9F63_001963, partial [Diploptera punctata]